MEFTNTAPVWNAEGAEPSAELRENGFQAGYKPPAAYFNYLFNKYTACIGEVQEILSEMETLVGEKASADGTNATGTWGIDITGNAATATKLKTARTINGMSFDGSANRYNYGVCSTAAGTAEKTVSCTGFTLATGAEITVMFTYTNTAENPKLNVNGTGAKSIYYKGATIPAGYLKANDLYTFKYVGTRYELVGDINTTYDSSDFLTANNPKGTGALSIGRKEDTTVGSSSVALGASSEASGNWTTAMGYGNAASGQCATAIGMNNTASNNQAVALGSFNTASGYEAFACNARNTASGSCSFAAGNYNEALTHQAVFGHYNDTSKATENATVGTSDGTAFVIGNGTASTKSNAFRVTGKGQPLGKLAYGSTGADMAELREWLDGNPENEDRRGYFVTMDGLNIKKATAGDYICGVISSNPCLIGNSDEDWLGRYVFDEFGAFVYEEVEETDPVTGEKITCTHYKTNPEYDPTKPYVQRQDRPEWDYVGLCGVINTRDDGTCEVNGFCKCGEGGIATKSEKGYRVLERVNDHIVKILFYLTGETF